MASRLFLFRRTILRQTPRSRPFTPSSDGGSLASSCGTLELLAPPLISPSMYELKLSQSQSMPPAECASGVC
ncbi:unnamed protein product [Urochloa humidicola]